MALRGRQVQELIPAANLLWVEGRLGPVERACLRSIAAQGHAVNLWHYGPLEGAPDCVELRDGDEIVPREKVFRHVPSGSFALFSNLFRYELLRRGLGLWFDCDVYLLAPARPDQGTVLSWGEPGLVASAVLGLPTDSPILGELIGYFDGRRIPPWLHWRSRLLRILERQVMGRHRVEALPWGTLGPHGLTWMVARHGLTGLVRPQAVFSPWTWREASVIFEPGFEIETRITSETLGVHLYNEMIRGRKDDRPPAGSLLERLHREGA